MTEERAEKFLELFNKGKEFTEELLRENQRLRYRLATLETESTAGFDEEVQRRVLGLELGLGRLGCGPGHVVDRHQPGPRVQRHVTDVHLPDPAAAEHLETDHP